MRFSSLLAGAILLLSCVEAGFAAPAVPLADLPLEVRSGYAFVEGRFEDGKARCFLVDSGAANTVISPRLAHELQLKFKAEASVGTSRQRRQASYIGEVPSISIGDARIEKVRVSVAELIGWEFNGHPCDALMSQDFFRRFVVQVDYPNQRLRIYDPHDWRYEGSGRDVAVSWSEKFGVSLPVRVHLADGSAIDGSFLVDTGAPMEYALHLSQSFVKQHPIAGAGLASGRWRSFNRDRGDIITIRLPQIEFAGMQLPYPAALIHQPAEGAPHSDPLDVGAGVLGYGALKSFVVWFDHSRSRLLFEKGNDSVAAPTFNDRGFSVVLTPTRVGSFLWLIDYVAEPGPAADAGVQPGDLILAIEGVAVTVAEPGLDQRLQAWPAELPLHLTLASNGKEKEVVLQSRELLPYTTGNVP